MESESSSNRSATVRVRLIRKMAQQVDGVDISTHSVGETFELSAAEAGLLVAEGWAIVEPSVGREHDGEDLTLTRTLERLRELRAEIEQRRRTTEFEPRRAEDVIREELRDSRAKTIRP